MNRATLIRCGLAAALLCAGSAQGQYSLEILSLKHRTAEQVLPALQPLVEPGGALTGHGNQLLVRTSSGNLAELRRALEAIDQPARRLEISVRFDGSFDASRREIAVSGRLGTQGSNVEMRTREARVSGEGRVDQRLQVLDGGRATIYSGEATSLQDTRMGFDIVPRVTGSTVQIEIAGSTGYTNTSGAVGRWFELGAVASESGSRRVWIKVDPL